MGDDSRQNAIEDISDRAQTQPSKAQADLPWFDTAPARTAPSLEEQLQASHQEAAAAARSAEAAVEAKRREALLSNVRQDYLVVGAKFYFRERPAQLAFKDDGKRLVTQLNGEQVAFSMAALAEAKGWQTIKVSGHPDFRRDVWLEASLRGIAVKGFEPHEHDLKELEARRERLARNAVRQEEGRKGQPRTPAERGGQTSSAVIPAALAKDYPAVQTLTGAGQATGEPKNAKRTYAGTLLDHGAAPFNHDPKEKPSYFLTLRLETGNRRTLWGVDLERAIETSGVRVGDAVKVEHQGRALVLVKGTVRDESGKVVGQEPVKAFRNQWLVEKADLVKAVAVAVVAQKVKSPEVASRVLAAIDSRLAQRVQQGRVPSVLVYDKTAPARADKAPSRPQVAHSARTR
jgi:putative DNA primase/helicase